MLYHGCSKAIRSGPPLLNFSKKQELKIIRIQFSLRLLPSTVAFCYYSYSDSIVVTALTGKTSSLHTLCSCRLTRLHVSGRYFATAFVYNPAKVVSQGEFNMPRNHILWSSVHIKAILMKTIFNSEKSGLAKPDWPDWLLWPCISQTMKIQRHSRQFCVEWYKKFPQLVLCTQG